MLVPLMLPSDTVLLATPVPMSIVCAAEPPIVTAPDVVPVPMLVVKADALSLIVTLPSVFSVPSTFVVEEVPPMATTPVLVPVLIFVG